MALEVSEAGEWIEEIKAGTIVYKWFWPFAQSLANPIPRHCHPLHLQKNTIYGYLLNNSIWTRMAYSGYVAIWKYQGGKKMQSQRRMTTRKWR
jgi:hypothetical protein